MGGKVESTVLRMYQWPQPLVPRPWGGGGRGEHEAVSSGSSGSDGCCLAGSGSSARSRGGAAAAAAGRPWRPWQQWPAVAAAAGSHAGRPDLQPGDGLPVHRAHDVGACTYDTMVGGSNGTMAEVPVVQWWWYWWCHGGLDGR